MLGPGTGEEFVGDAVPGVGVVVGDKRALISILKAHEYSTEEEEEEMRKRKEGEEESYRCYLCPLCDM